MAHLAHGICSNRIAVLRTEKQNQESHFQDQHGNNADYFLYLPEKPFLVLSQNYIKNTLLSGEPIAEYSLYKAGFSDITIKFTNKTTGPVI